ncbi:TetR/AcrR family transcriptional regulator [Xenorhabdus budapestensis]|uniref:TetR/AcrR family transcriptional regulator n=1 Tax=Xenorhabdus budapestensis TaxID=290110 RepID=A0ABX7VK48_XENBU|nr:TetR/AcrR family transcriptional regulator [Xenorhabdus budapestensis]QTL40815.1 TetR/AcrR family transcriptional regulator [Xenorhabdus budapestensis]
MILFDEKNLSPIRRRTLERMTKAALKLYDKKTFPSPKEIAEEAEYAKITLRSYFQTHNEFVEYVVKQVIGSFVAPKTGSDAEENVERLFKWGYGQIEKNEALMRDALRISQLRWQEAVSDEKNGGQSSILKKSNRRESLTLALEPLKNQLNDDTIHKIIMLLSVLYGTEAMVVLKDSFCLENDEIVNLMTWSAKLIIRQAIIENLDNE